jgi:protein tyrosine phosphatase (PTP) superfamily phosphohydrolase (DUF442 family)
MTPRFWVGLAILTSALLLSGCKHCCKRPQGCCPTTGGPPGPGGAPFTGSPNLPPQNIPLDPPPGRSNFGAPEVLLPSAVPPGSSGYTATPAPKNNVALGDPDFGTPAVVEEKKAPAKTPPPPFSADEGTASLLPVGIANFAKVKDDVSNGLRPSFDGLDWLHSKGVKTVVYLRNGKEDDSSDRKQVENRGMKYVSLEVTPEKINAELVVEFNRLVNNADGRPLFVYDLNGTQAGAMWYLYFRTSEMYTDDEARVRAGRFGLKEKGDADQVALWTAVQKYLAERNPKN